MQILIEDDRAGSNKQLNDVDFNKEVFD